MSFPDGTAASDAAKSTAPSRRAVWSWSTEADRRAEASGGGLDQAIAHYAKSLVAALGHSELARVGKTRHDRQIIRLSSADIQDIKVFLKTLTGPVMSTDRGEAT